MNHPSDLIDELIKTHLKPVLKELGFKNKSSTYFRQNGELIEIISPQKRKWNDAGEAVVLYVIKGERDNAKALLEKAIAKNKHAKAFFRTLAQKLGL